MIFKLCFVCIKIFDFLQCLQIVTFFSEVDLDLHLLVEEEELRPQKDGSEYNVYSFYSLIQWPLDKG